MLADDFGELVAQRLQEVLVGGEDVAIRRELDHGLGTREGGQLAGILDASQLALGDVGRELDDLVRLAAAEDRVVGGLDPDLAAALGDAAILAPVEMALGETIPEGLVVRTCSVCRIDEQPMVLADDLGELVAECLAEVLVGSQDASRQVEFDDGLRAGDSLQHRLGVAVIHERYSHRSLLCTRYCGRA